MLFAHSGKSYEDSDVRPYRKPRIAADETTEGASGDWKRKLARDKPRPEIDVDSYKIKIKGTCRIDMHKWILDNEVDTQVQDWLLATFT